MSSIFVDVDGHVLEPSDLWTNNLEERYRDKAIRLEFDENGLERWNFGGKISSTYSNGLAANVATIGKSAKWRKEHIFEKHEYTWEQALALVPGAWDPHERIKVMDKEGIDVSILYPTLGLTLATITEPELAAAYCRVYNDWIIDFCRHYPSRLVPAITLPWHDVKECLKELKRTAAVKPKVIKAPSGPPDDISYGHTHWDPIWAELQLQDIPVSLHVGTAGSSITSILHPEQKHPCWWTFVVECGDIMASFVSFIQGGAFDRFPKLKLIVLESGCAWMPYMLHRMDEKHKIIGFTVDVKEKPSDYFKRQGWISMDPDDELGPDTIKHLGADKLLWAFDYPHSDSPLHPVKELKENLKDLPEKDQALVMGENAVSLYRLPVAVP